MLTALTRRVGAQLADCELTYVERDPIDIGRAREQHRAYERALESLGVRVDSLAPDDSLPDAVFVEDGAVMLDEIAVLTPMGSASRRPEVESLLPALQKYRTVSRIDPPSLLEGGDVLRIGRTIYVGLSTRTNERGISELARILDPLGYDVRRVDVPGCLHLKTGVTYIGKNTLLANPNWVDLTAFGDELRVIEVPDTEPWGANALRIHDTLLVPASVEHTQRMLRDEGFEVVALDVSEFQKAEAGLTCMSIVFAAQAL
jgi:dimethylargininase